MDNYLFLDIDGVLNSKESFKYYSKLKKGLISRKEFDEKIKIMPIDEKYGKMDVLSSDHVFIPDLNLLIDFINENNIKVVGISSWFIQYELKEISKFLGIDIIDRSEYCGGSGSQRSEGVDLFFKKIGKNKNEVNYVIFDDSPDGYTTENFLIVKKKIDYELLEKAKVILKINK